MIQINLYDIYKKVKSRERSCSNKSGDTIFKCYLMIESARSILDKPTLKNVKAFKRLESDWSRCYDVSSNSIPMATQFEDAIRSTSFYVERPHFNRHHLGWNEGEGAIYCIGSPSKPSQVKIGATTMELYVRLRKMKTRYGYPSIKIYFAVETDHLSDFEDALHKAFSDNRVSGRVKEDSLEWFWTTPEEAFSAAKKIAKSNGFSFKKIKLIDDEID